MHGRLGSSALWGYPLWTCLAAGALLSGCQSTSSDDYDWNCSYTETLLVATDPPGARVFVNDTFKGVSPCPVVLVDREYSVSWTLEMDSGAPGSWECDSLDMGRSGRGWTITVRKDDYHTVRETLTAPRPAQVRLTKEREPTFDPMEEDAKLAAEFFAETELLLRLEPIDLASGTKPAAVRRSTEHGAEGTTILTGTVAVTSDPGRGEVYVDGVFVGQTPTRLTLTEGTHTIRIQSPGHGGFERDIRVLSASSSTLHAKLNRQR